MKVLMVEPGKVPREVEISPGLKSLQAEVGGDIQAVYPYDDPVALICHEEGKLIGLPLNRALTDDEGKVYDIIAGKFLIVGLGEESFDSLTDRLVQKYAKLFEAPEEFVRIAGKYVVVKQPIPEEVRRQQAAETRGMSVREQLNNARGRIPQEDPKAPKKRKEWER